MPQPEILYQISEMLSSTVYRESLIEKALDLVVQVIQAERALFVKYNEKNNGNFRIISARHIEGQNISDLSSFSSGILQKVINEKKACLYHDVQSDPDVSQFESVQIHQIKSVMGVPVFHEEKIWGVILADSRQNRQNFSEDNLHFLEFFAHLLSLAIDRIIRYEALEDENRCLLNQLQTSGPIPQMLGESTPMKNLAALIHKVARTDATVLILGESGTGKDLAAGAIHKLSSRNNHPYLAQFCGSIPDTLLESELFGYKRGAFSGANSDKKGLFEVAQGGTFFLDEIADISLALQAKLLRVIQNKEIIRLGDTKVKKVDVRLIAATNTDLKARVKEGKFRQDLFYRLNVFPIYVPPLREHKDDIVQLVQHFIDRHSLSRIKIDNAALKKLKAYHWPGNVR
jgi:Nif-specific regulatory protein